MLLGGDELGRTQGGNNNAYCQDNDISWFDWDLTDDQRQLLDFTSGLIAVFREHPVLRRRRFFQGRRDPRLEREGPDLAGARRRRDERCRMAGGWHSGARAAAGRRRHR